MGSAGVSTYSSGCKLVFLTRPPPSDCFLAVMAAFSDLHLSTLLTSESTGTVVLASLPLLGELFVCLPGEVGWAGTVLS